MLYIDDETALCFLFYFSEINKLNIGILAALCRAPTMVARVLNVAYQLSLHPTGHTNSTLLTSDFVALSTELMD